MALFRSRKKFPIIEEIDIADEWSMFQGEHEGKSLIVRVRTSAKDLIGHPSYAHQVGIAVPLNDPDQNGFPSGEESKQLNNIEDQVAGMLESGNESLLVGIISTGGMREFVLYTTNPDEVQRKFGELKKETFTHALQLMIQPDKGWNVYKSFVR
jgi:hypothetical protein